MSAAVGTAIQWLLTTPARLAVVSPSGEIEVATPNFASALGVEAARLAGVTLASLLAPDDRMELAEATTGVAAFDPTSGQPAPDVVVVAGGRVGHGVPFRCRFELSPVPGAGAAVVTVERLNPELLPVTAERHEPTDTFTNDISGALSHDIRASLRSVNGFLGLVERSESVQADGSALKHLRTSRDAGVAADRGVDAIVRLMRIRERVLVVRSISLAAVIDKGIQQSLEVLPGNVPDIDKPAGALAVLGDPLLLGECIGELFTNARKFGGDSVKITVSCAEQEGWLYLTIADSGPGVAPEFAHDAFRMFRLLQPKGKFPGVGMGLALARVIAESHGGTLRLEPRVEPGAVASLRLPSGADHG